jgi:hypothetical protein
MAMSEDGELAEELREHLDAVTARIISEAARRQLRGGRGRRA